MNSSESSERLRGYFLAFGSVGHYLKRAREFHGSLRASEPLPPRWLHLAERSLLRARYPRYLEFLASAQPSQAAQFDGKRLAQLDSIVDRINDLLSRPGILEDLRKQRSPELRDLSKLYTELGRAVYGAGRTSASGAKPAS